MTSHDPRGEEIDVVTPHRDANTADHPARTGLFVSIDGPGGSGKTTLVEHLHRWLTDRGHLVHATTEPSHDTLGLIARHRTDVYDGHALACLVAADRYHHVANHIRPALAAGHIVLCDRYVPSSYVFQRLDGVPIEFIAAINADADRPDLAVILTADPVVTVERIAYRGAHTRFETDPDVHRREADLYRDTTIRLAAAGYHLVTVDSTAQRPDRIVDELGPRIIELAQRVGPPPPTA